MDIIEKAKELGGSIASSEELINLKECEQNVQNDSKAKLLINNYRLLQAELVKATKQNKDAEIIENIRKMALDKQEEINKYETTKNFFEAKDKFDRLMKKVNDVIIFTITGETGCSSDGCSSCSECK